MSDATMARATSVDRSGVIAGIKVTIVPTLLFTVLTALGIVLDYIDAYIATLVLLACFLSFIAWLYSMTTFRLEDTTFKRYLKYIAEQLVYWGGNIIAIWLIINFAVYLKNLANCIASGSTTCDIAVLLFGGLLSLVVGIFLYFIAWAVKAAVESYEEMGMEVYAAIAEKKRGKEN